MRTIINLNAIALLACAVPLAGCGQHERGEAQEQSKVVNVYSGRHYDSDRVLFDAFAKETGIKVNLVEAAGDALIERLAQEKEASPADVFLTADAGILWRAEQRGLFRPITDEKILAAVPAQFRHPDGLWIGLAKRARIIIYDKEQGLPEGLTSYEDLAKPAYRGMICIRSSSNVYNQSLLASIIAHQGAEQGEAWARGVVANFARAPEGNDTTQIEGVASGRCRVAVVNSYYVARFLDQDDEKSRAVAARVGVLFPNQSSTGAHVNISGAGVTKHAPNAQNAEKLLGFLLLPQSQKVFARGNNEYPAASGVEAEGPVAAFGPFKADELGAAEFGRRQAEAVMAFDRAGWQ